MNFNFVEETSDVVMAGSGSFLELLEIYRPVQMHQANRSQYAPVAHLLILFLYFFISFYSEKYL